MDVVAGVASIAQLAVCSQCAAKYILRLYNTAQNASSLVKCQQEDILFLLQVIHRLISDNGLLDSERLLPVLIRVIEIARTLSNWFDEPGFLGIKWTLVKKRSQIDDALKILKRKSDLLGLYMVGGNHTVFSRLETRLNKETTDMAGSVEETGSNLSRKRLGKRRQVMNLARTSTSESSPSQSSAGQSLSGLNSKDEGTKEIVPAANPQLQPQLYQQPPQPLQPQYQQCSSATQSNDQQPQERQKTLSKLKVCGNNMEESNMSLANGSQGEYRDFDFEFSGNIGKKSNYNTFNGTTPMHAEKKNDQRCCIL